MKNINTRQLLVYVLVAVMALGTVFTYLPRCTSDNNGAKQPQTNTQPTPVVIVAPPFNADSAYNNVQKQVDFGPRVPGTEAHKKCADWLAAEVKRQGLTVITQPFTANFYFGKRQAYNIIGQYKPELPNRILLCAHWDSRHIADKDDNNKDKPILGADDGGSGVGVLLEIARLLKDNPVNIGVDFVLFDAEDLGDDTDPVGDASPSVMADDPNNKSHTWCLGSQYWAKNPHKPGYKAQFGILLDMVGAVGAKFPLEGYSYTNAPQAQQRIWAIAQELGYGGLFLNQISGGITDDHLPVMRELKFPVVDIISLPGNDQHIFGSYHHTHADNMSIISRETLGAVGKVVSEVVYRTGKPLQ
ncbi:MAG: M28 family peptidase [Saprospiraceae bacterium]|nr:M28 family peptidase [Saprospiraceae bacterium]